MKTIHSLIKVALGAVVLLSAVGCKTNLYDEEQYEKYRKYNSPVDSVDQYQEWKLTAERTYEITIPAALDIEKLLLLTDNPLSSSIAYIMAQSEVSKGESKQLTASVPLTQTTIYVALVDKEGTYYVASSPSIRSTIDFSGGFTTGTPVGTLKPQTYM